MEISKLVIRNYKIFKETTIEMNRDINIFVGENDAGKSTILEALSIVLCGKINGGSVISKLTPDWFNKDIRNDFQESIKNKQSPTPPTIEIEAYFYSPDENETKLNNYRGTNNSLKEDYCGISVKIE